MPKSLKRLTLTFKLTFGKSPNDKATLQALTKSACLLYDFITDYLSYSAFLLTQSQNR
jgi:hypothetical protein